jgi:hypothetical protein
MKNFKIVALATSMMLLLSGCMRMNMDFVVNSDDTVSGSVVIAASKTLLEATGSSADELLASQGVGQDLPSGVTTEAYDEDGYAGSKMTFTNLPLSEMAKTTGAGTADQLAIVRKGDQLITSGTMDMSSSDPGDQQLDAATQALMDSFDINVSITYPGTIVSSTGTIDGNKVTWHINPGDVVKFDTVVNAPLGGGSGSSSLLLPIAGGALAVLLLAIVLASRRKRPVTDAPEAPETPIQDIPAE